MKGIICAVLLATGLPAAAPEPPAGPVGRYQIITARVFSLALKDGQPSGEEKPITLRLDTTTGRTWQFLKLNVDGKTLDMWQPVSEPDKRPIGERLK